MEVCSYDDRTHLIALLIRCNALNTNADKPPTAAIGRLRGDLASDSFEWDTFLNSEHLRDYVGNAEPWESFMLARKIFQNNSLRALVRAEEEGTATMLQISDKRPKRTNDGGIVQIASCDAEEGVSLSVHLGAEGRVPFIRQKVKNVTGKGAVGCNLVLH